MKTLQRASLGAALALVAGLVGARPAAALDFLPSFKPGGLEVWTQSGDSVQLDTWRALGENRNPKSDHPWQVSPALMASLLSQLRVRVPSGSQPLLEAAQIERLAGPLAAAFGKADARLDVVFAARAANGLWTRGRAFYVNGQLNVIVGGRGDEDRAGERGRAADAAPALLVSEAASAVRADWVQLPVQQIALTEAAPAATTARAAALEAENARLKTELAAKQAPVAPTAVAPAATTVPADPVATPAAPKAAADVEANAACLGSVKERLAAIDALRAAGAISAEEQRAQRKRILDAL